MQILPSSLKEFILAQSKKLAETVQKVLAPDYVPGEQNELTQKIKARLNSAKKPYPAQQEAICALLKGFKKKRAMGLIAEMGTGKTLQASYVSRCMELVFGHATRTLVLCPTTLISTWTRELQALFGDAVRIIDANGPDALSLLAKLRLAPRVPDKPEVWICGFNRMKISYSWSTSYYRKSAYQIKETNENGVIISYPLRMEIPICPRCAAECLYVKNTRRTCCGHCGEPLWGPAPDSRKVYAPVMYIKKYLKKHFHLLITDEAHKLKGSNTIQGAVLGQLAGVIPKTLVLTGTLSGGKASDIYYLLQRVFALNYSKEERCKALPSYSSITEFIRDYGSLEKVHTVRAADPATGRASREDHSINEKPGISPLLLRQFFIDCCVFLRVSDIADALPGYQEVLECTDLTDEMRVEYEQFEKKLRDEVRIALRNNDMKVVGQMLHSLLAWPDFPQRQLEVLNKKYDVVATAQALDIKKTPKDERLLQCALESKANKRKFIVYVEYTGKMGALEHISGMLRAEGLRPLVLKSVSADKRLEWIEKHMATGSCDCLITHPQMVETGMNLLGFQDLFFWETGYSVYLLRQAARRSWRPGQTKDVTVRFFVNRGTMQEKAMSLIACKLEAALVLEGELSENGLVSLANQGDNMSAELARALVGELTLDSLESTFASYRALDSTAKSVSGNVSAGSATSPSTNTPVTSAHTDSSSASQTVPRTSDSSGLAGRKIGSICGLHAKAVHGRFRGYDITLQSCQNGGYDIIVNGSAVGQWTGHLLETVLLPPVNLLMKPQPALPGMVNLTVYRLAA